MAITAAMVKELREKTGAGMMDCKKALTATDGDAAKAVDWLREKGIAKAEKKAGRVAAEGAVGAFVAADGKTGCVVEINCETDFAAGNDQFKELLAKVAEHIVATKPADMDALNDSEIEGKKVSTLITEATATIGEKISLRRFACYETEGRLASYIHMGGKIGVLVNFDTDLADKSEFVAYGKDVAMQIAALNTPYLTKEEVPAEVIEHEKSIMVEQLKNDPKMANKPEQVLAKIVDGKIGKYYKENCLVDQEFVKDNKLTVAQYTKNTAKALGGSIEIKKFIRFEKGEGIEKRQDDFAAEVASMVK